MITYEEIKNWCAEKENKNKVVIAAGFLLIFLVGFGAGRYERGIARDAYKPLTNYTTKQAEKPAPAVAGAAIEVGTVKPAAPAATSALNGNCPVKGNISSAGKKIFHVKGGAFYDRTKAEQCFNTPSEAIAAGFVKSSR